MPIHAQFYRPAMWTKKVGQGDLVFEIRLVFASGLRVQDYKSLCTAVMTYATLVVPKCDSYILTPVTLKSRSNCRLLCIHVRCTYNSNLVTTGSRDTAHKYFCDRLKTSESRSGLPTFCVQSGFASGSVHARLQVSVYSGYNLCHSVPKFDLSILTPCDLIK